MQTAQQIQNNDLDLAIYLLHVCQFVGWLGRKTIMFIEGSAIQSFIPLLTLLKERTYIIHPKAQMTPIQFSELADRKIHPYPSKYHSSEVYLTV